MYDENDLVIPSVEVLGPWKVKCKCGVTLWKLSGFLVVKKLPCPRSVLHQMRYRSPELIHQTLVQSWDGSFVARLSQNRSYSFLDVALALHSTRRNWVDRHSFPTLSAGTTFP